ncbi:UDP-N-acetylmuramoyl-L-alanyl-D-glutamate--2,6-diaminopimelate ligase [Bacillus sp. V5-8f]|uniref:UDP-N-acetylmuramoyl-L-alanyl-D-glutamate--2, 6-diaminopimelate ligase n=1 Tax=Bacillus sp. V5-8f TaxID=2053044 RepID=UPI000C777774|nr:UDP-N-acetylmuramoyl-L-alanyl-D-glutamate--2,6-diaminopimelate ligase [Bacillus sp. V5-8f]PLT34426.1 UDP-N-acetylmuramoyl-L-alanyl-D-glutamate--2,6-diaminopimelate ligase [Bacillus sp. V5-8f]
MKLSKLVGAAKELAVQIPPIVDVNVTGIEMNSKKIEQGYLFIAIPGFMHDGHDFIEDAIQRGAAAIIGEKAVNLSVPYIQVTDSRTAAARLASAFYGFPARKHKLIGITGTNGKTTTSYMLRHILSEAGYSCSLLGTVAYIINGEHKKSSHTTPDPIKLQKLLADSKDEFVIMEVSSHALDQARIEGIEFDVGIFTNLRHDHLDYHHTMENYFRTKASMFMKHLKKDGHAVVNQLDEWGVRLSNLLEMEQRKIFTVGKSVYNHIQLGCIHISEKSSIQLYHSNKKYTLNLSFPGLHNGYNAALAYAAAKTIGIGDETIIQALESFKGVPGRFEVYSHPAGATFVVDYAHTQDAVEYCLKSAKQLGAKHISHIYGFRGGRDPSKRKHIVEASAGMSDSFILTFDDLNGINGDVMINELEQLAAHYGMGKGKVISDRTVAISEAWQNAKAGEWVFITGKGPERYKEMFSIPARSDQEMIETLLMDQSFSLQDATADFQ